MRYGSIIPRHGVKVAVNMDCQDRDSVRWTHLSRQYFGKVKLHFGAVFLFFFMCPVSVSGGLTIAKLFPPAALSRNLTVGNPV